MVALGAVTRCITYLQWVAAFLFVFLMLGGDQMQKMERVEGQEMETTEQKTEVYTDNIHESIANYCIDHDIDIKDIYSFDQQRWNSVLLYLSLIHI